jgi:hypothetical protein
MRTGHRSSRSSRSSRRDASRPVARLAAALGLAVAVSTVGTMPAAAAAPPEAYGDFVDATAGAPVTIVLYGFDADEDPLTFAIASPPGLGTLGPIGAPECDFGECTADVTYTPPDEAGEDSFTFTVNDGTTTSAPATVDVFIETPPCGAVISNGTVQLGINCVGDLNVPGPQSSGGTPVVGLRYVPTNNDSTSPGCACEGWGVADATTQVSGYANESEGRSDNLTIVSFTSDADSATSVVDVGATFRITHDYQPSTKTPNLYAVSVTIENRSAATTATRYRRVMDWDVEPTEFAEVVTLQRGNASELVFTSNDGFASADPLAGPSDLGHTGSFTDVGPDDHGALFDFDFGSLAPGASKTFSTYYGAAGTEAGAIAALGAVGAESYSFGQPSTSDGPTLGTPNTFVFAFSSVGGGTLFTPDAVDDSLSTPRDTAKSVNVLDNDTDPNGDPLTVTTLTPTAAHGSVSCTAAGICTYTPAPGYVGPDSFDYTISDGNGGSDSATVTVTVTAPADTTPPDTTITAGPTGTTSDSTPTFSFTATEAGSTFECRVDGGAWVSCTTPFTTAVLADGAHTFEVRATDGAGNTDPTPASRSFTVATPPPPPPPPPPTPTCLGKKATIVGTAGPDNLTGTNRDDVIVGLGGGDTISGGGGNDIICGGDGNDVLVGAAGNDRIDGGTGKDKIGGGGGNDVITGGDDDDRIKGNGGDDELDGGDGDDHLRGAAGDDVLKGRDGDDALYGQGGDDVLSGGADDDTLDGGPGRDKGDGGSGRNTIRRCEY